MKTYRPQQGYGITNSPSINLPTTLAIPLLILGMLLSLGMLVVTAYVEQFIQSRLIVGALGFFTCLGCTTVHRLAG